MKPMPQCLMNHVTYKYTYYFRLNGFRDVGVEICHFLYLVVSMAKTLEQGAVKGVKPMASELVIRHCICMIRPYSRHDNS